MISLEDISEINRSKEKVKNITFSKILDRCNSRIYQKVLMNETQTFISVPPFIVGEPLYDLKELIVFIYKSFKKRGYWVKYIGQNQLYISWKREKKKITAPPENSLEDLVKKYSLSD